MNISNYNNAIVPLYGYNESSMTITKNNNNIYTYKHTTTQSEEEHNTDDTKQIINLICQDVEIFIKTNEHEYINYCSICKNIFKFFNNSYILSFKIDIQETNNFFMKLLHNAASAYNFYLCRFSFYRYKSVKEPIY